MQSLNRIRLRFALIALALLATVSASAKDPSLYGSRASLERQQAVANAHGYTFLRNRAQLNRFVTGGYLVPIEANEMFDLSGVSFPYARPEVKLFLTRLGQQYQRACGEKLVVTSLTRPQRYQPSNASSMSVHPTGMAVDLRRPNNRTCRRWLENVLLSLEGKQVLEASRERRPPHYHVALFPKQYAAYVETLQPEKYRVRKGDSLWRIARAHNTSVQALSDLNGVHDRPIYVGEIIEIPQNSCSTTC